MILQEYCILPDATWYSNWCLTRQECCILSEARHKESVEFWCLAWQECCSLSFAVKVFVTYVKLSFLASISVKWGQNPQNRSLPSADASKPTNGAHWRMQETHKITV